MARGNEYWKPPVMRLIRDVIYKTHKDADYGRTLGMNAFGTNRLLQSRGRPAMLAAQPTIAVLPPFYQRPPGAETFSKLVSYLTIRSALQLYCRVPLALIQRGLFHSRED